MAGVNSIPVRKDRVHFEEFAQYRDEDGDDLKELWENMTLEQKQR